MKAIYILLTIFLISQNICEKCSDKKNPSSVSDCRGLELDSGDVRCCYVYEEYTLMGEKTTERHCVGATQNEYDNIDLIEDFYEELIEGLGGKVEEIDIDCHSVNYLFTSLLSLIILLLLF